MWLDEVGDVSVEVDDLSAGDHVITMLVTDEVGATCSDYIIYSVGTAPTLSVETPSTGDVVEEGELVTFQALIGDNEDAATDLVMS